MRNPWALRALASRDAVASGEGGEGAGEGGAGEGRGEGEGEGEGAFAGPEGIAEHAASSAQHCRERFAVFSQWLSETFAPQLARGDGGGLIVEVCYCSQHVATTTTTTTTRLVVVVVEW